MRNNEEDAIDDGDYLLLQPFVDTTTKEATDSKENEHSIWKRLVPEENPPICTFLQGPYALDILMDHDASANAMMVLFLANDDNGQDSFPLALSPQRFTKRRLQNIQIHRVDSPEEIVQALLTLSLVQVGFIGMAIPDDNRSFWKNDTIRNTIVALLGDTARAHSARVGIADMEPVPFVKKQQIIRIQPAKTNGHHRQYDVTGTLEDWIIRLTLHETVYDQRLAWEVLQESVVASL